MKIKIAFYIYLGLFQLCCGSSQIKDNNQSRKPYSALSVFEKANHLFETGNYLSASFYFEATLNSKNGLKVLPSLIVSQVRCGRLLAALANTRRLYELNPQYANIDKVQSLLEKLTNQPAQKTVQQI